MADTHLATVGELIEYLGRFPRDMTVVIEAEDFRDIGLGWTLERVGLCSVVRAIPQDTESFVEVEDGSGEEMLVLSHYSP